MAGILIHLYKSPLHVLIKHVAGMYFTNIHTRWLEYFE